MRGLSRNGPGRGFGDTRAVLGPLSSRLDVASRAGHLAYPNRVTSAWSVFVIPVTFLAGWPRISSTRGALAVV